MHYLLLKNSAKFANISDSTILPIGFLGKSKLKSILIKHSTIQYIHKDEALSVKNIVPCYIHHVFKDPRKVYGIHTARKKTMSVERIFNDYKSVQEVVKLARIRNKGGVNKLERRLHIEKCQPK